MTCAEEQVLSRQLPAVPFYCPVEPAVHPGVDVLNDLTVDWMLRQNLDTDEQQRKRLAVCDFGGLTAWTMPYGRLEPLTLMARFHAVLFSLDDGVCDETDATADLMAQETSRILRAVEAPAANSRADSPHTAALRACGRSWSSTRPRSSCAAGRTPCGCTPRVSCGRRPGAEARNCRP